MKLALPSQRSQLFNLLQPLTKNPHHSQSYACIFQLITGQNPKIFHKLGQQTHAQIILHGLNPIIPFLASKMVAMYASLDDLHSAILVFNRVSHPSTLLYNSIIRAYTLYGQYERTLESYNRMRVMRLEGDHFTYPFVLKSCAELASVWLGRCVHGQCLKCGLVCDMYVGTSLIDTYVNCSSLENAREVFDELSVKDVASWNALIAGYMKEGSIQTAENLFNKMSDLDKNVLTWTTMISGYTQNGLSERALSLFNKMLKLGPKLNSVTILSVLPACAHSAALDQGKKIHQIARDLGLDSNPKVQAAIAAMYAKCGSLSDARICIDTIHTSKRNLVSWNVMITAYASHGRGAEAVSTFEDMVRSGVQPDSISFTGLLSGCSHSGLIDIGLKYFYNMRLVYNIDPKHEHYACVVDLLSRAGRFLEAENLIIQMPMKAGPSIWGALLFGSRKFRNLEMAKIAATELFALEPENSGNYILLSNMYAEAGLWEEVKRLRTLLKSKNIKKNPGSSWIEINGKAHLFLGGDKYHPKSDEIYLFLEKLPQEIKSAGYIPDTSFALHDVSEEERESSLSFHSEKLAVAFGLLNTGAGTTLRVTKNLRICEDCHTVMKFISRVYNREIIVRDVNRFHHFRDGSCSCGDYW